MDEKAGVGGRGSELSAGVDVGKLLSVLCVAKAVVMPVVMACESAWR